jgi:hypothetical protein
MRRDSLLVTAACFLSVLRLSADPLPSVPEMAASARDVWGEASLRQPGGPSYEFFRDLLPPLRYVNTEFRHYPIVLSAPAAAVKARWVSNGSAVNARAYKKPMWREVGFPVRFAVGADAELFGQDVSRLDGPRYRSGYLPIVHVAYRSGRTTYEQEAFTGVRGALADNAAVFVRFTVRGEPSSVRAEVGADGPVTAADGALHEAAGRTLVLFDAAWHYHAEKKELRASLAPGQSARLIVLTRPLPPPVPKLTTAVYDDEARACADCWTALVKRGLDLEVPEPVVNDAWRALIVGNLLIAVGDRMHYSAGNAYDHLYEAECGDAVRSLMLYGYTVEARRMVGPLLTFNRQATRFHVAGHKLQLLTHYYWVTRDTDYMRSQEAVWKPVADFIVQSRKTPNGLLPRDRYAGDISWQVYALNSNANCWRGLRDLAAVLDDLGEHERAVGLFREADAFRKAILDAVAKSERRAGTSLFIPNALLDDEQPYDPIPATQLGSYYNLMAPYILGSGIFAPGSERETALVEYPRRHSGLAMGMIRTTPQQGEFNGQPGVNVLYGLRYQLALLRRDERDRALVGFYGQLAQGMTRDTFIGGEGSRFLHGDRHGRSFYLPPNSASNAMFLTVLRYLLIQDWDLDDDGRPETLRLLYGVPGRWLKDGAVIRVGRAPTMFGEVSFRVESHLERGEVVMTLDPPPRRPKQLLVRLPLPPGWKAISATTAGTELPLGGDGAVNVSGRTERCSVRFRVVREEP